MSKEIVETPLMKQYIELKAKHPDAILLFRVGDFYETFSTDAILASEILGITLTRRANGAAQHIELAGFPHHALDTYLPKLVRAGKRVAICEQLEDPKATKKLVKRGITELVTPGVSMNDVLLENKENNFLASIHYGKNGCGVAFLDISTGEFLTAEGTVEYIDKLINSFSPKEVLYERHRRRDFQERFGNRYCFFEMDEWVFTLDTARERLLKQFETKNLKGFGIEYLNNAQIAAGAILYYLDLTQHTRTAHVSQIGRIEEDRYVRLDRFTIRNLELVGTLHEGGKSLLDVLDRTVSPMGGRLLKRWALFPLKECGPINDRLAMVETFTRLAPLRDELSKQLALVGDLERIISKVAAGRVNPREVVQLKVSLTAVEQIKTLCHASGEESLQSLCEQLNPCRRVIDRIERELQPNPPVLITRGEVICDGVDDELDQLRTIAFKGKDYLLHIQQRESEQTGIPSLKIAYNNVFGYYIEVRNTHKDKVPTEWIRKQTLVNAERYITQELKDYEEKILGAEEKIVAIETRLFGELVSMLVDYIQAIQLNASLVARIDCLLSLARVAIENHYVRPLITSDYTLDIQQGRHPVIEKQLPAGESYIANDLLLDKENCQIIVITGPNMAGKSALLRQTALIVLMAQMGSFVPAQAATVGLVDKIFTRVGASDNISMGESTFMVEMNEAADILNNVSDRSLILFDELGRGTSTYDGISIAWAIVEYLHQHPRAKAKTLFATHYHELNEMEALFPRIKNYNVSVKEVNNRILFMRKLVRGGSEHSFGIHVAKMAGMPQSIVNRANQILKDLEAQRSEVESPAEKPAKKAKLPASSPAEGFQLSLFQLDDPVLSQVRDQILATDINHLTPLEALNKLNEIKRIITGR